MIPLSSLVNVKESVSPRELNHFGQRRSVTITANLSPDYSLGEALKFMDDTAAKVLKPGYTTDLNGTSREFKSSQGPWAWSSCWRWCSSSGAGRAVRELHRPAGHHGVGTAVHDCALLALQWSGARSMYSQIGLITLVGLITKHGI